MRSIKLKKGGDTRNYLRYNAASSVPAYFRIRVSSLLDCGDRISIPAIMHPFSSRRASSFYCVFRLSWEELADSLVWRHRLIFQVARE